MRVQVCLVSRGILQRVDWAGWIVLTALLTGCVARPPTQTLGGFVNHTRHSDADLQAIWLTAQQSVAQGIDLNPLQQAQVNVPPDVLPGDPRAINVMPQQLTVAAVADVSSQALFAATGTRRAEPTGLIACPKPCNVRYATAYSSYDPPLTQYAASWEFDGDNFTVILEYEFENHILNALGYNTQWR